MLPLDTLQCCSLLLNPFRSSDVGLRQCCARKPYFSLFEFVAIVFICMKFFWIIGSSSHAPPPVFLRLIKNVCQWMFSSVPPLLTCNAVSEVWWLTSVNGQSDETECCCFLHVNWRCWQENTNYRCLYFISIMSVLLFQINKKIHRQMSASLVPVFN